MCAAPGPALTLAHLNRFQCETVAVVMHEYEAREVTSAGRPAPFSAPALFPVSRGRSKTYCPESHTNSCRMTSCPSARGRSFTLSTSFPTNGTWSRTLGARSVSSRPITCRKACRPRWKSSSMPRLRPAHTSTNQGSHAPQHRQRMDRLQLLAVPHALSTGVSYRHSCHARFWSQCACLSTQRDVKRLLCRCAWARVLL